VPADAAALLQRRDAKSRSALEAIYCAADLQARVALLRRAADADNEPFDLLRLGLRDDDDAIEVSGTGGHGFPPPAIFAAAVAALVATATPEVGIDLQDALARCDDATLAHDLLAACDRVGAADTATAQFAARLRAARRGIARAEAAPWLDRARAATPASEAADPEALETALDAAERAARSTPGDGVAQVRLALANLALAQAVLTTGSSMVPLLFEDARRAAERARPLVGPDRAHEADAVAAIALWQQGEAAAARERAEAALAAADLLGERCDGSPPWFAELLRVAARSAASVAYAAPATAEPAAAAPDAAISAAIESAAFAFAALGQHGLGTPDDAREAAVLLAFAGARREAFRLLQASIGRWPDSRELHDEFRRRTLADRGAGELRLQYATFVAAKHLSASSGPLAATTEWFAGYAAIVAAEVHVQDRRGEEVLAAYTDAIDRMRRSAEANPEFADSANHFAVLAYAGRALQYHLDGKAERAVEDLVAAAALRPASLEDQDGLERTPAAIRRRVARELRERGQDELAARLADDR
jgi:hypothetical protein